MKKIILLMGVLGSFAFAQTEERENLKFESQVNGNKQIIIKVVKDKNKENDKTTKTKTMKSVPRVSYKS